MAVSRNLVDGQRDLFRPPSLGENEAVALMDRYPAAQIGQGEGRLSVPAVGGADQLKQCFVLADRQELSFAEHPTRGREVAREHPNLSDKRLGHRSSLIRAREDADQRDTEAQRQKRLQVEVRLR